MTSILDQNPQKEQMEDESMIRTLRAQTLAIWPQESQILFKKFSNEPSNVLDLGCGTGLVVMELASHLTESKIIGVDILQKMVEYANTQLEKTSLQDRVRFQLADALDLPFEDDSFDLILNRHVLQIIPDYDQVLKEIARVLKPGGRVHVLAEDYGMIHFDLDELNSDFFWQQGPLELGRNMGTEMQVGRKLYRKLKQHGFTEISVDYVTVDTIRVDRRIILEIWEAWRDGYTEILSQRSSFTQKEVAEYWERMIEAIRDPDKYAVWNIPIYSAIGPA